MPLDTHTTNAVFVKRLAAMAGSDDMLRVFGSLLYADAGAGSVDLFEPQSLLDQARIALDHIRQRARGRHSIRVRAAKLERPEGAVDATIVEILNDDMPFLVDSVVAELQARGLSAHLVLHPIFKVRREPSGQLETIIGPGDRNWGDGSQESFIALVLDPVSEERANDLSAALAQVLDDVRISVTDWQTMLTRLDRAVSAMEVSPPPVPPGLLAETLAFCRWLRGGQFTFLGASEYRIEGDAGTGTLELVADSSLGVLRNKSLHILSRNGEPLDMTPEMRRHLASSEPLIVTKSNIVSRVHRRVHMDYVGLKTYRPDGSLAGELRLVGLFTSQAYTQPPTQIPFVRHKVEAVASQLGYPPSSHAGKVLANVLDTFPRDELFQIPDDLLAQWASGILDLDLRPRLRVFVRSDRFDRFVSALVYVPRDRFSTATRERIGEVLARALDSRVTAFTPFFPEGPLVRVHFILGRNDGPAPSVSPEDLEYQIAGVIRTWSDQLLQIVRDSGRPGSAALADTYANAFSAGYAETFQPERALTDIARIERLGPERPAAIDFYHEADAPPCRVRAAVYRFDTPIPLSQRVPVLENLGFSVIDERSYRVTPRFAEGQREVALHDMVLEQSAGLPTDLSVHDVRMEEAFLAVFRGDAENDGFNRLIIAAGADWREVAVIRAYAAYMRQIRSPFGPRYIAETLHRHAGLTRDLIELFRTRFDPDLAIEMPGGAQRSQIDMPERAQRCQGIADRITGALAGVQSLDEDRILRGYLNLVQSTVRTNFFQRRSDGRYPDTIAFKLVPGQIDGMPEPRPFREIWVYSPRVEAIHLRFAAIARGGIRWSDRAQDFRTEVLGLCKAQQVKNTVIVPTGAKGGFVPKQMPRSGARDDVLREAMASYRIFISALLDITDNIRDGVVIPPERVVRHEPDDPYLVVAADKGTATFSDLANSISAEHGFWLGDAFASGGSAGYDHKKMGITARGAWECVKRHFREMDVDIQTTPFRVTGVGDMSGDVFGNGMLLSPAIRLVAAFDHRDIFIDPAPDAGSSLAERKRLFDLPRSSWQDYDKSLLSKGGGVFSRQSKSIALSDEIRALLGIENAEIAPNDLIRAILKCETDLLWFGGIGTYIRSSTETDEQAGDRANDPVRITGSDLRARVIGEGANLAVTQKGRVEFAARGGRINTDFIDNSAGVNSSDIEVNIKIALGPVVASGRLDLPARNELLASMTDDVAEACLVNNYHQSLALSITERRGAANLGYLAQLVRALEGRGLLDRKLEALPSDAEFTHRETTGATLSRPELAVLLSWSKIALSADLLASDVPDDPACAPLLSEYFPPALRTRYPADIVQHRLRREIVAMRITNSMINRGGPAFAVRLADETGRSAGEIAYVYLAVRAIFGLPSLWAEIDALDGRISGSLQLELYGLTQDLLIEQTADLLRNGMGASLDEMEKQYRPTVDLLEAALDREATPAQRLRLAETRTRLTATGVPDKLAGRIAALPLLGAAPAITRLASEKGADLTLAARTVFAAQDYFRVNDLKARSTTLRMSDYYDRLALSGALGALEKASRMLAGDVLSASEGIEDWLARHGQRFARAKASLDEIAGAGEITVSRLVVAASQVRDLTGG